MLHSYQAELNGSQLIWIGQAPLALVPQRVMVVVETASSPAPQAKPARLEGFIRARGCMGRASREHVLASLDSLRDDWARDPLGTPSGV